MGIDYVYGVGVDICIGQCSLHARERARTVRRRAAEIVGICAGAITHEFRQRLRAPPLRRGERLDHQRTGSVSERKTVAISIKRFARMSRGFAIAIASDGTKPRETGEIEWSEHHTGATRNAAVDAATGNQLGRLTERHCARCTRNSEHPPRPTEPTRHRGEAAPG